jgi:hypothetical protein
MAPPRLGARIGATPSTSVSCDIITAAARPVARSRTTARGITVPAAPPNAEIARNAASQPTLGDSAAPTDASA